MAGRVLLKIAYLLMRWLFGLAALAVRGDQLKDAEPLVLRHENAVLPSRRPGAVRSGRPGLVHRAGAFHPARALGRGLSRDARDAPGLAPQACGEEVRHEQAARARPTPTIRSIARVAVRLAKENSVPLEYSIGS
ncbi:MAG TPA: hypothetical protein VIV12_05495 [Streptosporangiaceae bacterium]